MATSGDYDIWYKPCEKCGYDTGKSTMPKEGNKRCWKCGYHVSRDYSNRALKIKPIKYKTKLNGQLITGTYNEICKIIANSGLMSMHPITKIDKI